MRKYQFIDCPNPEYSFEILFSDFIEKCEFRVQSEHLENYEANNVRIEDIVFVNGFKSIEEFKYFYSSLVTQCLASSLVFINKLHFQEQQVIFDNFKSNIDVLINEETYLSKINLFRSNDKLNAFYEHKQAFKHIVLHEDLLNIDSKYSVLLYFALERYVIIWKEILIELCKTIDEIIRTTLLNKKPLSTALPKAQAHISSANLLGLFRILSEAKIITVSNVLWFTAQISELFSTIEKENPSPNQCKKNYYDLEKGVYKFWDEKLKEIQEFVDVNK